MLPMASKMTGLGMALQEPEPLFEPVFLEEDDDNRPFTLTTVNSNEAMYKEICIDFENADIIVVSIEKLTNLHLWKRYVTERDLMLQQRLNIDSDFKLNEKYLYHGTSVLKSDICEEGLDSRMSKQGCFGKGIYFSDYPRKCIKYAEKGDTTESFILLMRVILGTPKVFAKGQKDRALVREPEKSPPYTGFRFYDSVEGCPVNHKEFVVYENRRALVECIISYRRKDTINPLPLATESTAARNNVDINDLDSDFSDSDNDTPGRLNKINHGQNNLNESNSSDDEDANVATEDNTKGSNNSAEYLLRRKKKEFQKRTGVTDGFTVDRYLLRGNMSVSQAIKLYEDKSLDEQTDEEQSLPRTRLELEIEQAAKKPEHPIPGTPEWTKLSEDGKNAVIAALVDDFNTVTGLTDNDDYARERLASVNYNLDLAVLAHYEEM
jgi:hypothetical protein